MFRPFALSPSALKFRRVHWVFGQRRPVQSIHFRRCVCDMTQGARAFSTVGLPLFVLTVSGFYSLSHLVQGKFDVQVGHTALAQQVCHLYIARSGHPKQCIQLEAD